MLVFTQVCEKQQQKLIKSCDRHATACLKVIADFIGLFLEIM